ncbi:MAG TPA: hypothetical protein VF765_06445 [Polyangiaceae bacterium]
MNVDKASFFATVAALAAGGAGGYYAGDHHLLHGAAENTQAAGMAERQPSAEPSAPPAPAPPVCDDSSGAPAACPAPGYSADEGQPGCMLASKRCADFKETMKPRVAETAVACLDALTPAQRCDANRVAYCGHAALMAACDAAPDELGATCTAISSACGGAALTPTLRDCRATLAGLTALGREQMASCMRAHCAEKGLLGCETSLASPAP